MTARTDISIIVGAKNALETAPVCLTAIEAQSRDRILEIILVDASTDGTAEVITERFPHARLVRAEPDVLVPKLWEMGLQMASGRIAAFTNANLAPGPGWLDQIAAHDWDRFAAVGGSFTGPADGTAADWALYFSRYSGYLPGGDPGPVDDLAGDNAAYRREVLAGYLDRMTDGFWEHTVHGWMQADGHRLHFTPALAVRLLAGNRLGEAARMRFEHGQVYARKRGGAAGIRTFRTLMSPILPALLLFRIASRVYRQKPEYIPQLLRSMPALALLVIAWSAGEATGYLQTGNTG